MEQIFESGKGEADDYTAKQNGTGLPDQLASTSISILSAPFRQLVPH